MELDNLFQKLERQIKAEKAEEIPSNKKIIEDYESKAKERKINEAYRKLAGEILKEK